MLSAGRARIRRDLQRLGVEPGSVLLVHASMRAVRPRGGPATVVAALLDVLGPDGTLLVPTQTTWNSVSSPAYRAATAGMTPAQIARYRSTLPAFDPDRTPSSGMGVLAEYVRVAPGSRRSSHPQTSFAALGRHARELTAVHDLDCHLGERSPLAVLYELGGHVLHLGTGYGVSTVFHLAEYRYAELPTRRYECRVADRRYALTAHSPHADEVPPGWTAFDAIDCCDADFPELGRDFEAYGAGPRRGGAVRTGRVGRASARLFSARAAVDFATAWMRRSRGARPAFECAIRAPLSVP